MAAVGLTRARLYVQVSALESDLHELLIKYAEPVLTEEMLLDIHYQKCVRRRNDQPDSSGSDASLAEFLDFADYIHLLNQHSGLLPADERAGLRSSNDALSRTVPIRNRVMHSSRPLLETDPDDLSAIVRTLVASTISLPRLQLVAKESAEPGWQPVGDMSWDPDTAVLHNLPTPDFDETGLIGRGALVAQVTRLLTAGREPVITLVGQGGIGKTALALQVLSDLTVQENPPFEAILWASLKTESLTGEGIQQLRSATATAFDIPALLAKPLDESSEIKLAELAEVIQGTQTLIAIDNLETVDANQILELYDTLPPETRYLFTSRRGLGQLERRVPIPELSDSDAVRLLRVFSRRRGLERLARLPQDELTAIASELRQVPLAIKWFVMAVARGVRPEDVLHDQSDLLRFCLESVLESLSTEAHEVAQALYALAAPCSFAELGVIIGMPADDLRGALLELQQCAVVQADGGVSTDSFSTTEAVNHYWKSVSPPEAGSLARYRSEASRLRQAEERRRAEEERRSLGANAVRIRHEADMGAADLLRQALQASKREDLLKANELLDDAEALVPMYFEVHRVRAFIAAFAGEYATATAHYTKALELCEDSDHRAFVLHYYGEHLLRNMRDVEAGTEALAESHEVLQQPESAMSLARGYTFQGRYAEARVLLESAIKETSGRARLIAETSLLDTIYRASEDCLDRDRNPVAAIERALEGVSVGMAILGSGVADRRLLTAALKCLGVVARGLAECWRGSIHHDVVEGAVTIMEDALSEQGARFRHDNEWWRVQTALVALQEAGGPTLSGLAQAPSSPDDSSGAATGILKAYDLARGYGFIRPDTLDEDVFFHRSGVSAQLPLGELQPGLPVLYDAETDDKGRSRASNVRFPAEGAQPTPRRERPPQPAESSKTGRVIVYFGDRGYGFLRRDDREPDLYFHISGLRDQESYRQLLVPESHVAFDVVDAPPRGQRAVDIRRAD